MRAAGGPQADGPAVLGSTVGGVKLAGGRDPVRPRPARRRALTIAAWVVAAAAAFAAYLRLAQAQAVNSDGAAQALQGWDMLHGNALLHGWTTSDVSFYTTEVPQYLLVELVRGLSATDVPVAAALTYTLVVLLAALLAAGGPGASAGRRETALRVAIAAGIMLAPQPGDGANVLLSSPDHIGTSVPLLLTWLILDRARPRWYVPVLASLLLAWAQVADSLVLIAGVIPLAAVCALRVLGAAPGVPRSGVPRSGVRARLAARRFEAALGAGAVVAAVAATTAVPLLHAAGGFAVRPLGPQLASAGEIAGHNLPVTGRCLLLLTGADFGGLGGASLLVALAHLAGAALAAAGIMLAAGRFRRADLVSQVLVAAVAVNVALFAVTDRVYAVSSAREIAPALPFAAALAGRQLAGPLLACWRARPGAARLAGRAALPALALAGLACVAGLGYALTAPPAAPQAAGLTAWLERHHLGTGLSGYWEASVVTLTSGGRVAVRPVNVTGGRVTPAAGEVRADWFDPARSAAHFVALSPGIPGYPGFTDQRAVRATFGRPARVYRTGRYTIWYWPSNLLPALPR